MLGLVATGKRRIKPGHQYNKYFDTNKLIRSDSVVLHGTTFDTLEQMASIVRATLDDTKAISKVLKDDSRLRTAANIWHFLYDHVDYVRDDVDFEELRRPLRTWADRQGDCDCYSIFASSVLTNLGIDHAFRMAGYQGDFQHVYVVIPKNQGGDIQSRSNYIVIDPVTDSFDHEVSYSKKYDKVMDMPIKYLNGIEDAPAYSYPMGYEFTSFSRNGIGATHEAQLLAQDFMARLKNHLSNTYRELKRNPSAENNQMADQVRVLIDNWHDPVRRTQLLDQYTSSVDGLFDGSFFTAIKTGISKVGIAVNQGWEKVKTVAESLTQSIMQNNPSAGNNYSMPSAQVALPQGQQYQQQPTENNLNTWLLLGAAGLVTVMFLRGQSYPQKSSDQSQKNGLSGSPKKHTGGRYVRSRKRHSAPVLVMN